MNVRTLVQDIALQSDPDVFFGHGRQSDFNALPNKQYPFVWLDPLQGSGAFTEGTESYSKTYQVALSFLDLDSADSSAEEYGKILDRMEAIADKFVILLNQAEVPIVITGVTYTPAIKVFADCLTGQALTFTLQLPDTFDYCAIINAPGRCL
jgi:hypothetical protein